jgi:membrane protein required for colicin V production
MPDWIPSLAWIDVLMLAVLALSVVIGLVRGLMFEVMSLVGWVVAYLVAQAYSGVVASHLPFLSPTGQPGSAGVAAFVFTFIVVLVAWSLLARFARLLVQVTPLSVIDRVLGGAFGALRGLLLLLVAATIVMATPAQASAAWRQSHGAQWLAALVRNIQPLLPFDLGLPPAPPVRSI